MMLKSSGILRFSFGAEVAINQSSPFSSGASMVETETSQPKQIIDRFGRSLTYLRLSVTDRCDLRCRYCMPAEGIKLMSHKDILSYDEITAFVRLAVLKGIDK